MTLFLLNILMAVLWCFTWGSFDFFTFAGGIILSYGLLGLYSRVTTVRGYGSKVRDLLGFVLYFFRVVLIANLQIAYEILTPGLGLAPRVVRFDVTGLTAVQRTVLINAINLTPGTLAVDLAPDRRTLYVHCMHAADNDKAVRELHDLNNRLNSEVF